MCGLPGNTLAMQIWRNNPLAQLSPAEVIGGKGTRQKFSDKFDRSFKKTVPDFLIDESIGFQQAPSGRTHGNIDFKAQKTLRRQNAKVAAQESSALTQSASDQLKRRRSATTTGSTSLLGL